MGNEVNSINVDKFGVGYASYTDGEGRNLHYSGILPTIETFSKQGSGQYSSGFDLHPGSYTLTCKNGIDADIRYNEAVSLRRRVEEAVAGNEATLTHEGWFSDDYDIGTLESPLKAVCEPKELEGRSQLPQ